MSPYQKHVAKWKNCQLCGLCKDRRNVVIGKGTIPAPVCFIGEAPGESEDVRGTPFVGTSGREFHSECIGQAMDDVCGHFDYSVTNLLGCAPWENRLASRTRPPEKEEIEACSPRVVEFINLSKPKLIVTLGEFAGKYVPKFLPDSFKGHIVKLPHPAAISRINDKAQKDFAWRQLAVRLGTAVNIELKRRSTDE